MKRRISIVVDCSDPNALAKFWAPALGYKDTEWGHEPYVVLKGEDRDPLLILQRVREGKAGKNRVHFDLYADDIEAEAARLVELGAKRRSDPFDENGAKWIVMSDPEGNEFCVCRGLS